MDETKFRSLDMDRININEYYEVEYWAKQFGLRPTVFKGIVRESGISSAKALREFLSNLYKDNAA